MSTLWKSIANSAKTILITVAAVGLLAGCSPDADSNTAAGQSGQGEGVVIHYDGQQVNAAVSPKAANPMLLGQLKTFRATLISGWVGKEGDPSAFGLITTRLILKGDSETEVATGRYQLVADSDGMGMLSGSMQAALVIEGATLGLPKSLSATSGTLTVNKVDYANKSLGEISLEFDGTFVNSSGESDNVQYQLSGTITMDS
jgi:hypothetical protein